MSDISIQGDGSRGNAFPSRGLEISFTAATFFLLLLSGWLHISGLFPQVHLAVDLAAYFTGGYWAVRETLPRLFKGELDVDFLMIVAAIGAAAIGQWHEGIILLFLFSLSNTLQSLAMDRSRRAISRLMQRRPKAVSVLRDGEETIVPVEELRLGDIMIIRPGELLPTDGALLRGETEMDEASITGESKPAYKQEGDTVYAGAINGAGAVEVAVTQYPDDSTLARIVRMVENAQEQKVRTQQKLERFESGYAYFILIAVALLVAVPVLLGYAFPPTFYRAMTVLVVASPCALILSTPAAVLSAIARAARAGVLFKGGAYIERMAEVKTVVFDKTGTLTTGRPGVTDVMLARDAPPGFSANQLLAYAAALESRSEHVLAQALLRAAKERGLKLPGLDRFVALPGRGVHGHIEGYEVWLGGNRLYEQHGEVVPEELLAQKERLEAQGKSVLILHRELRRDGSLGLHERRGGWLGLIGVSDTLRGDVVEAITACRREGIERAIMLTGDNETVAAAIAKEAGVDAYYANLLPEEKVEKIKELEAAYGGVMMIGDGVNDAPALAHASVGVAMGGAGTDVALESAHCVLMGDELLKAPFALHLARRTVRTIRVNLAFSLAVIVVLIGSVFLYHLPLPHGVVAHEGSTLIVCLNGLRLLMFRDSRISRGALDTPAASESPQRAVQ